MQANTKVSEDSSQVFKFLFLVASFKEKSFQFIWSQILLNLPYLLCLVFVYVAQILLDGSQSILDTDTL